MDPSGKYTWNYRQYIGAGRARSPKCYSARNDGLAPTALRPRPKRARDIYLTERVGETLLRKAIVGCKNDEVSEIGSLGDTLDRWSAEILNHHCTGASNGPTEGMNRA